MWQKVTERIIRQGLAYTTEDFNPTAEDIKAILSVAPPDVEIGIVRVNKALMVFKNSNFVRSGKWFRPDDLPPFCSDMEAKMASIIKELDEFHTDDIASRLWPEFFIWKSAKRDKDKKYSQSEGKKYDWRVLGRTRVYNVLNGPALENLWVKKIGPSLWKSLI